MPRKMKESGVEWLGQIPEGWGVNLVFQVADQVKSKNEGLREQNLLSLSYGKIKRKSIETVGGLLPQSFDGYNIIEADDIVLRLTDLQNDQHSLRVGISSERGIITSAYTTLRPRTRETALYLYYSLHAFDLVKGFYGMGSGVRQGLNYDEVKLIKLPRPSAAEQQRIAAFLDERCAKIDGMIAEAKASIEDYKKWKQSIIFEAVTGKREKNLKPSGVDWIGDVPEGWEIRRVKTVGLARNGLTYSPDDVAENRQGVLVLRSSNIQGGKLSFDDCVYVNQSIPSELWVCKNDIIICSRNGSKELIGKCALISTDVKATFGAFMMVFRACSIDSSFAYWTFNSGMFGYYLGAFSTSTINQLTRGDFDSMQLPLPPLPEQRRIAAFLDEKCTAIDKLVGEKEALIADLEAYKKSLIFETVTGKREVA